VIGSSQPSAMTSNVQLNRWCKQHNVGGFQGVFSSNDMTEPWRPKDACWIVNHSPSNSPSGGSHWLSCRVRGSEAFWFDSYGLPPHAPLENDLMGSKSDPHPHFDQWLRRMGVETVSWNEHDLQSVASEVCGLYACWFAKNGLPELFPKPWSWLTPDVTANDRIIAKKVIV
jgi:hypothetical protein